VTRTSCLKAVWEIASDEAATQSRGIHSLSLRTEQSRHDPTQIFEFFLYPLQLFYRKSSSLEKGFVTIGPASTDEVKASKFAGEEGDPV